MFDFIVQLCGHGDTKDETAYSLTLCYERLPYKFSTKYVKGDALIGRSRSCAATQFLNGNYSDYMIFLDTDISFAPEELERLFLAMREGHDIIAGAYSLGNGEALAVKSFDGRILMNGGIQPAKYVSTGFMGISRKALLQIKEKLNLPLLHPGEIWANYPFFESGRYIPENIYISEDWDFCNKAREAGLTVYLHTGVMVDHVKEHMIIAEDTLNKILIKPVPMDMDTGLIPDLAEYLGKPLAEVRATVVGHGKWFSKSNEDWLYELAQFNSFDYYKGERLKPLEGIQGKKILDFGCGIGTAAMALSSKNVVIGYDMNPTAIAFAKYRAEKHGFINAHFMEVEPDYSLFDLIVCIDVLEHFEDLRTFLIELGTKVKKGCRLYHFDAFFDHNTEGHFDHSAKVDGYLAEAGFVKFDQLWAIKS